MTVHDFGRLASTWDSDPLKAKRAQVIVREIVRRFVLPATPRILEVGAGTGLVSQHLAGISEELTLLEPSAGMRSKIEEKISAGLLPKQAQIWAEPLGERSFDGVRFDLMVSVMVLHHIANVPAALGHMHDLLANDGRLVIVDLEPEDGSFHSPGFTGHHGFNTSAFAHLLESVGMTDVRIANKIFTMQKDSRSYPLFMASGTAGVNRNFA